MSAASPSSLRREPFVPIEILALTDGEINLDRIDGGHGRHGTTAWIDQGTHLKLGLSGDAVDRRNQSRKIEIDLSGFDGSLVRFDLRFSCLHSGLGGQVILNGIVEILLARRLFSSQWSVTVHIKLSSALLRFGIGQIGSGLRQLPLGLIECCLKGSRVNLEK